MLFLVISTKQHGKSYDSVKGALKAIGHLAAVTGCASPTLWDREWISKLLRAIKKHCPSKKRTKRLPITASILRKMLTVDPSNRDNGMDPALAATAVIGFFGFFRAGELVDKGPQHDNCLRRKDVSFDDNGGAAIFLRQSKTDWARRGQTILLHENGTIICPVAHLRYALQTAKDKRPDAPVFQRQSGAPVTYSQLMEFLRERLAVAGFDPAAFGTQSLRIGAATQLAILGFGDATIRAMGRWTSACFQQLYIRQTESQLAKISAQLAKAAFEGPHQHCGPFGGVPLDEALLIRADTLSASFANQRRRSHRN
jgi:hypothetical protein